jgi:tetrapyrrole methylase family protein/MazG family protein
MTGGRVVVVGLGPAGVDLLVPRARTAFAAARRVYVRTARHPAVEQLGGHGVDVTAFDDRYDAAVDFDEVYEGIVAALVSAAAEHGRIAYAVPGNPGVAERTVALLRERAKRGDIELEIVPGLSFVDLAWSTLGVDPMDGARVVDAQTFAADSAGASGPLLIGHCISRALLSDVKLVLLESLPAETSVTVLQRLGLPDERVLEVELAELDRAIEPDHLTSVYVDAGTARIGGAFTELVELARQLRGPGGCPWDAEQTHHSLARYLLEEAYETVETIEALPADAPAGEPDLAAYARLEDELGDLLFQVVFHSILAAEAGAFTVADVAQGIHAKLVRRHPHVFGDAAAETAADVLASWEQIKKVEKGTDSLVEGISPGLPALLYAHKLYRKAVTVGLEPGGVDEALDRAALAIDRLRAAPPAGTEAALGDLLAAAVVVARARGVDAETALSGWNARFRARFVAMEQLGRDRGVDLAAAPADVVAALWIEAAAP